MKLLFTTLLLLSIAFGPAKKGADETTAAAIAHEYFETPAAFAFGNSYYLDVDKDGTNDFQFSTVIVNEEGAIHTKYLVNTLGNNEVLAVDGAAAFNNEGNAIAEIGNELWSTESGEIIEMVIDGETAEWQGTWSGDRSQYLGVKLVKENKTYVGWVNVSIDPENETAFVHGYALNRNPNGGIAAGQL